MARLTPLKKPTHTRGLRRIHQRMAGEARYWLIRTDSESEGGGVESSFRMEWYGDRDWSRYDVVETVVAAGSEEAMEAAYRLLGQ